MNWGSPPYAATSQPWASCILTNLLPPQWLVGREKHPWVLLSTRHGGGARPEAEAHVWHPVRRRAGLHRESAAFYTHLAPVEVMAGGGGERLCGCGGLRCCRDVCACGDGDFRAR